MRTAVPCSSPRPRQCGQHGSRQCRAQRTRRTRHQGCVAASPRLWLSLAWPLPYVRRYQGDPFDPEQTNWKVLSVTTTSALLASAPGAALELAQIERRDLRPDDVSVRVTHSGVCFTDLHRLASPDSRMFPLVSGHQFVGVASAVGATVTTCRVGDSMAIGNIIDSCGECNCFLSGQES